MLLSAAGLSSTVSGSRARLWLPVVAGRRSLSPLLRAGSRHGLGGWDLAPSRSRTQRSTRSWRASPARHQSLRAASRSECSTRSATRCTSRSSRRLGSPLDSRIDALESPSASRWSHAVRRRRREQAARGGRDRARRPRRHAGAVERLARVGARRAGRRPRTSSRPTGGRRRGTRPIRRSATGGFSSSGSARITRLRSSAATRRRALASRLSQGGGDARDLHPPPRSSPERHWRNSVQPRVATLETGLDALDRLRAAIGADATVVPRTTGRPVESVVDHTTSETAIDALLERLDPIAASSSA